MTMTNLTRPGEVPVEGDTVIIDAVYSDGVLIKGVTKTYHEPPADADAPSAVYRTKLDTNEFLALFTGAEMRAIDVATATDDDVYRVWRIVNNTNNGIDVANPATEQGMQLMVLKGLLTQSRYEEIIKGVPLSSEEG